MSSDFSDMPDYSEINKITSESICKRKGCKNIESCCGCQDYFTWKEIEDNKKKESECKKSSNCPRQNIFEGMTDEEIDNLFNDYKKEKAIKEDQLDDNKKPTEENNALTLDELIKNYESADSKTKKEMEKEYPQFFGNIDIRPGWERMNYRNKTPDEKVELLSEEYNPIEYPEINKALKDSKDLVKPEKDLDLNTLSPDEDDIPSDVNYGKCGGIKNDINKPQLSLVPMQMVRDAALARMYGNNKYKNVPGYSSNNWCTIDKQRVIDALLRHILLYLEDMDGVDAESGLPHLCHVAANLSFLCEMQQPNWEEKKNKIIANDPILSKSNNSKEK